LLQVFTTAAYDDHKNIVLLAFEIIEKIIRDYFPYITETETTTFTDCVNCLIAFTNSRFNKDISLNAIAFLRFCDTKLAEGDLGFSSRNKDKEAPGKISIPSPRTGKDGKQENGEITDREDHLYFWFPLLAGKETG
jgi:brefeldin A-inhibited guanine nucleotide-exchange protein